MKVAEETHWIQTQRGRAVDLWRPEPDDIDPAELACLLSRLNRFGGHTRPDLPPYTVAQHSVLVAELLPPELQLAGLLHDAHEGYLGCDLTRPLKRLLGSSVLGEIERRWDDAVCERFGLSPVALLCTAVKAADDRALVIERRSLLAPGTGYWESPAEAEPKSIEVVYSPQRAAALYLHRLNELIGA